MNNETIYQDIPDEVLVSFDVDWAPDSAIDFTAQLLIENNIKATWFLTHKSEAVERLFERKDLFDIGIHPNFLAHSTHGNSINEIMTHVMQIAPNAKSVRTHGMYYSAHISKIFAEDFGLLYDSSIYLKEMPCITPQFIQYQHSSLLRMPYFWEETGEMMNLDPFSNVHDYLKKPGMKIFDFHPIHVKLNSSSMDNYNIMKNKENLITLSEEIIQLYVETEKNGARSFLIDLIKNTDRITNIAEFGENFINKKITTL